MKAISVKQPWAYLLCSGIKPIENRTWKLPERYKGQTILIHASGNAMTWQHTLAYIQSLDNSKEILDLFIKNNFNGEWVHSLHVSAIIGSVVFTDCVQNHPSIWAEKNTLKVGDVVPYNNTRGNIKNAEITSFEEIETNGKTWFHGIDTETKAKVWRPNNISLELMGDKPIYNWVASNPILFDTPIPAKGKLSFWDFPNIKSEKDEDGKEICCCNLGIPEKDQVLPYGGGDYRCKYCGSKWYK